MGRGFGETQPIGKENRTLLSLAVSMLPEGAQVRHCPDGNSSTGRECAVRQKASAY